MEKYHFGDVEKCYFYSQKEFFFLSRTLLNLMSNLVLTENKNWKKVNFFSPKAWVNPFGKVQFVGLGKILSLSRTLLNLISSLILTENKMKKIAFLDQGHGLTSLEKWDFGDFEKVFSIVQKSFFFLYKVIKHYFYSYFDQI